MTDGTVSHSLEEYREQAHVLHDGPGLPSLWLVVTDSVAAVVKYVVEEAFIADGSVSNKQGGHRQREHILNDGPALPMPPAVKLVVEEVFGTGEKFFTCEL